MKNKFQKAIDQLNMQPVGEISPKPQREKSAAPRGTAPSKAPAKEEHAPDIRKTAYETTVSAPASAASAATVSESETESEARVTPKSETPARPETKRQAKKRKKAEKKQAKADKKASKKKIKSESKSGKKNRKAEKKEAKRSLKREKKAKKAAAEGTERRIVPIILLVLAALIVVGSIRNYNLNNQLKPVFYQVQSNKVVDNVRIVAISDMHLKEFGTNNERLVNKIKSYHPDIIAVVGDMNIESNPDYSAVINLCARLNNIAPLYYALGNHEFEAMLFDDSQIYYDLEAAGIKVLNNETEIVEVGLSTIDVIGLTQGPKRFREDAKSFFDDAMSADDNFKLVLTHYPENFDGVIEEYPIDLAICGHAHGGQVRLPVIGGLYSADQGVFPKLCDGYHEIENSKVIITKGLGRSGVVPRINNPPEITIIDINWY